MVQFLCQFSFLHCQKGTLSLSLSLKQTHTHSHTAYTAVFVVGPTRLWRVDGHFVGIRPYPMLALGSQLEGIGGERLQVLQHVGSGRLKTHFLLKGHEDNGTVEDIRLLGKTKEKYYTEWSIGASFKGVNL